MLPLWSWSIVEKISLHSFFIAAGSTIILSHFEVCLWLTVFGRKVEIEKFCFQEKIVVAIVVLTLWNVEQKEILLRLCWKPHLNLNAASIVLNNASAKRSSSNHRVARRNQ